MGDGIISTTSSTTISTSPFSIFSCITDRVGDSVCYDLRSSRDVWKNFYIFGYTGRFYSESSSLFSLKMGKSRFLFVLLPSYFTRIRMLIGKNGKKNHYIE